MTAVDTIRRAAAMIRERANLPYAGGNVRWEARGLYVAKTSSSRRVTYPAHAEGGIELWDQADSLLCSELVAEYIASWCPAVALAVAAWLDVAGADLWAHGIPDGCESCGGCETCDDDPWAGHIRSALTVARAYLGEQS